MTDSVMGVDKYMTNFLLNWINWSVFKDTFKLHPIYIARKLRASALSRVSILFCGNEKQNSVFIYYRFEDELMRQNS